MDGLLRHRDAPHSGLLVTGAGQGSERPAEREGGRSEAEEQAELATPNPEPESEPNSNPEPEPEPTPEPNPNQGQAGLAGRLQRRRVTSGGGD
eukprot:scaffold76510_cov42-Phaeocystis_antarctica.AAC.1